MILFRKQTTQSVNLTSGKLMGRVSVAGVTALQLVLSPMPERAEASSGTCLTSEEIINTDDLSTAIACDAHGSLFITYNSTLAPPSVGFEHPFKDYEAGLATFQALRREIDIKRTSGLDIKHELQVSVLIGLLQYSMATRPEDHEVHSIKLQAIKELIEVSVDSEVRSGAAAIEESYTLADDSSHETRVDALCYWANEIPGLDVKTVTVSSRYINCVESEEYDNLER